MTINGAACGGVPVGRDLGRGSCSAGMHERPAAGRTVSLSGSGSTDDYATPTPERTTTSCSYEWLRIYGLPTQAALGTGPSLDAWVLPRDARGHADVAGHL
jgi:hypothetical protein